MSICRTARASTAVLISIPAPAALPRFASLGSGLPSAVGFDHRFEVHPVSTIEVLEKCAALVRASPTDARVGLAFAVDPAAALVSGPAPQVQRVRPGLHS